MCDIVICVHRGQSAPDAEKNYLDNAKLLAFYGVDFHHATVCTISLYCDVLSLGWLCDTVVNAGLSPANFPCPALDLQLTRDH